MSDLDKNRGIQAMKRIASIYTLLLLLLISSSYGQGFLRRENQRIVNGNGEEVILRGMGLGGWMLQEGYMLQTSAFANAQHEIREKIEALIGPADTDTFYETWLANFVREIDVDSMAAWGFNSIRLPMHYNLFTLPIEQEPVPGENTWLDKGFELTDMLLSWCEEHQLYLILDLHAAPGGQGYDAGISDYDDSKPSLWESAENKLKTVALWRKLAERYADEPWIGGYDLINETNWDMSFNLPLKELYVDITDTIREVDTNHILFIEGNWFANDFTGLTPPWDDNMVYSFHKYWSYNDQASIQWVLNISDSFNIPVWCGEAGENSNTWFTDAIRLLEDNGIGWAWWPLKKVESISGPLSVIKTIAYQRLLDYWNGNASKPTASFAKNVLMELADNLKLENCFFHKDVIDAMFRQVRSDEVLPYAELHIPGILYASDYDLGANGYAYFDTDVANYQVSSGSWTGWNSGWAYRNDGVDIQETEDTGLNNGYNVGWTETGEWMDYTVQIESTAAYDVKARVATEVYTGKFQIELDGRPVSPVASVPFTGGWQQWSDTVVSNVVLEQGEHTMTMRIKESTFNLNHLEFTVSSQTGSVDLTCLSAQTSTTGRQVIVSFNKKIRSPLPALPGGFSLTSGTTTVQVNDYAIDATGYRIVFQLNNMLDRADELSLSYSGSEVFSTDGTRLQTFFGLSVENRVTSLYSLPTKIEAEDFYFNSGFGIEDSQDIGGGQNLGWSDGGDYVDYLVSIQRAGTYSVQYRYASDSDGGEIDLILLDENSTHVLHSVTFPVTGGWQAWQTIAKSAIFPVGSYTLRVKVRRGGFNLNWIDFFTLTSNESDEVIPRTFSLSQNYPNPFISSTSIKIGLREPSFVTLKIFDALGREVKTLIDEHRSSGLHTIDWVPDILPDGVYFYRLQAGSFVSTKKLVLMR